MPPSVWYVLSGGATRAGAAIGALAACRERGLRPQGIVACSGSAGPCVFSIAGRYPEMHEWPERFDDPRLISLARLRRGPVLNIDYLIDEILMAQAPDLEEEVARSSVEYFIAATRLPEGALCWFSKRCGIPLFEQLRATKTISGVAAPFVEIDGVRYADGSFSASLDDGVEKAFCEGADKVLVIDSSIHGRPSAAVRALLHWGVGDAPPEVRRVVRHICERAEGPTRPRPNVYVCPVDDLPARHGLTRSQRKLSATIEAGYRHMMTLPLW